MYFATLHQDSVCNGVWFLACLLPKVKSSPFWDRLEVNLAFLAFMCINIIAACFDSNFPWFASHSYLIWAIMIQLTAHITWLLKSVGVMISWLWGRCLCNPRHPACSAVTENCEVKICPTVDSGISLLVIWPKLVFQRVMASLLRGWCSLSWCMWNRARYTGKFNTF